MPWSVSTNPWLVSKTCLSVGSGIFYNAQEADSLFGNVDLCLSCHDIAPQGGEVWL